MNPMDATEMEGLTDPGDLHTVIELLGNRQRVVVALMTLGRIAVGVCDLLVAAPVSVVPDAARALARSSSLVDATDIASAAVITTVLVFLRGAADLLSSRFVIRQIQSLHTDFLFRFTEG
jgi:hypothetical protein